MSNAIKYTVEGSVHVSLAPRDESVVLSVSDSGTSFFLFFFFFFVSS